VTDSNRTNRKQCVECFQWREDCDRSQLCRACRAERERDEAREMVRTLLAVYDGAAREQRVRSEAWKGDLPWIVVGEEKRR
jgi:hypothetical protein